MEQYGGFEPLSKDKYSKVTLIDLNADIFQSYTDNHLSKIPTKN